MTNKLKEMAGKILEINKTVISESNPATVHYKSCELDRQITILAVQLAQLVIEQKPIPQRECYQRGHAAGMQEQREKDAEIAKRFAHNNIFKRDIAAEIRQAILES